MKKSVNRSSRGGFTLIEIVVSTALLAVVCTGFLMMTAANARSNYTLGKAQQDMLDAGVIKESEKEEYHFDKDKNSAYWEGQINGKTYKAVYDGDTGEGRIESGN